MFATSRSRSQFTDMSRAAAMPARAKAVASLKQPVAEPQIFPAPTRGWILNENRAAQQPGGAKVMDNAFPLEQSVRARRGRRRLATVAGGGEVGGVITYAAGNIRKVFASTANGIYDVTLPASPTTPVAAVSGLTWTSAQCTYVQHDTGGGIYLVLVNGSNERLVYDGSSWSTGPAITGGPGANGNRFSSVWMFGARQWFVELSTMNAWYLATDALGGTATKFPMAGTFRLGGSLLFGATWSADAGNSLRDRCVFVTTEGEVAVYEGYDPAEWQLSGVYRIGRPLGVRAWFRTGGDLVIATEDGLIPMSAVIDKDQTAVAALAISAKIDTAWRDAVIGRAGLPWHAHLWPSQKMAMITVPKIPEDSFGVCFVINMITGAWARYTNWSGTSLGLSGSQLYMGTPDGTVMELEQGGSDDGALFTAVIVGLDEPIGNGTVAKTATLASAILRAAHPINPLLSVQADFADNLPNAPSAAPDDGTGGGWDVGDWDVMLWGERDSYSSFRPRQAVDGHGNFIAPAIQMTFGGVTVPRVELYSMTVNLETGEATA